MGDVMVTECQGQCGGSLYRQEAYPLGSISIIASKKTALLILSASLGTCGPMPEEVQLPACPQHCQRKLRVPGLLVNVPESPQSSYG